MKQFFPFFFANLLLISFVQAQPLQPHRDMNASEIQLALKKMNVLGSVLYVAAHPDDENTRMIAFLSKHRLFRTAYLSFTRGDGGQNLIGSETGDKLGLIRTQELLAARRTDGAEQYFSRANDFGFSKNAEETLTIWDKEKLLADAVWRIRQMRPDVVILRFDHKSSGQTHGHHTSSAILGLEAYLRAGDATQFPEQLKDVSVWKPKRIFWNTSAFFFQDGKMDTTGLLKIDAGLYSYLLGKPYGKIAADSRTMHQSQGMGSTHLRGKVTEYLQLLEGEKAENDMLDGVETSWKRIKGGETIGELLQEAYRTFQPENPTAVLPMLLKAYRQIEVLQKMQNQENHWLGFKQAELKEIIRNCAGLWFEVIADNYSVTAGGSLNLTANILNRSDFPISLKSNNILFANHSEGKNDFLTANLLKNNVLHSAKKAFTLKNDLPISQPYWLEKDTKKGMFQVEDQDLNGLPETPSKTLSEFVFSFDGTEITYTIPTLYFWVDAVTGEKYRNLEIVPEITANLMNKVYVLADKTPKKIDILLSAGKDKAEGTISLKLPEGWKQSPENQFITFSKKGEEQKISFTITPPAQNGTGELQVLLNGQTARSLERIDYPHIPIQTLFSPSKAKLARVELKTVGKNIGYYIGAGDEIPANLREIGYNVTELTEANFDMTDLSRFDAVIVGIRAYNTRSRIAFDQKKLLEYVNKGGNVIVQFNTNGRDLITSEIGTYPFKISRERVTVEEAPVKILKPEHPIFNVPNKITEKDFENWVQERSVYLPNEWDSRYEALLECHDPNEAENKGGLLVSQYGKGVFIYTSYAWFRQLPAGVAGAYRLFTNMMSYKPKK